MSKLVKNIIHPALVLTVICLVVTFLLALTNYITKDKIDTAGLEMNDVRAVLNTNASNIVIKKLSDTAYEASSDNNKIGYVFIYENKGYVGPVRVMTGVNSEGSVTGVKILSSKETAGLGSKAGDPSFLNQYSRSGGFIDAFKVVKEQPSADDEIQAVTGATVTSRAVTDAVNKGISEYKQLTGGASE